MCRERCGDGNCDSGRFGQELKECLKSGEEPTVTNADVNCCDGSYVGPLFEVTLPSGQALWMRMEDAYQNGLCDILDEYASDVLRDVGCSKQAAAVKWMEYSQQMLGCEKDEKRKRTVRALNDYITTLADQLKSERDEKEKETEKAKHFEAQLSQHQAKLAKFAVTAETIAKGRVVNEDKTRQKPMKYLDEALKILKSRLNAAAASVTTVLKANSSQQVDQLKSEIAALNARLVAVTQERDRERLLSGAQTEELGKARAALKEQAKFEKKNKKKGSA